ncbi:flagellar export chaperone FliS [Aliagarivorans taiwanensis]|uniref:flagellar export chaperone FliS n=1 Tax=Aliagarivorans taiwanensis TaxID=561966 RepID=UPI00041F2E14|nr:flagellar export chaperone FliS [Aliagarivorans taiwanensis]
MYKGINQYRQVGIKDQISTADPHQITLLLMQAALENLSVAKGCIERNDLVNKGKPLAKATSIIANLRDTLDHEKGGEIATNLHDLYTYVLELLSEAATSNDPKPVSDAIEIFLPIKTAWEQIPESAKQEAYNEKQG